jgi:hypothetical protein
MAFYREIWPGWALLLRLFFGMAYLATFMAYVGVGRVFPSGYTYWGLPVGFAGPVVYLFLWLLGYAHPPSTTKMFLQGPG